MKQKYYGYILFILQIKIFCSKLKYTELPIQIIHHHNQNNQSNVQKMSYFQENLKSKENLEQYSYDLDKLDCKLLLYQVKIGSNQQKFNLVVDTASSILWISGEGSEDKEEKIPRHYNPKASSTSFKTKHEYKIRYGSGYSLGYYYYDKINFFNNETLPFDLFMNFGVANKTKFNVHGADGVLGLGRGTKGNLNSSTILCLKNMNLIEYAGFSLKFNDNLDKVTMFLGEEHEDFSKGSNVGKCVLDDNNKTNEQLWSCKLNKFGFINNIANVSINLNLTVNFDTGTNSLIFPRYVLSLLLKSLQYFGCTVQNLSFEVSKIMCNNRTSLPDLILKIGNNTFVLDNKYLYSNVTIKDKKSYMLNVFFEEGINSGVLGLPFYYEYHTRFDNEKNIMKFFGPKLIVDKEGGKKGNRSNETYEKEESEGNYNIDFTIIAIVLSVFVVILIIINVVIKYKYCSKKRAKKLLINEEIDNSEILAKDD